MPTIRRVDWVEVHGALGALDPSLITAPPPDGLGDLGELWRLYGAGSYLPR